jgi:hypothetical protein
MVVVSVGITDVLLMVEDAVQGLPVALKATDLRPHLGET